MKKIIMLLIVLSGMAGISVSGMENSSLQESAMRSETVIREYTGWLTVTSPLTTIYDDESTIKVANNGDTVDFEMEITILGFFTGTVHIDNVMISGTSIEPGTTSSVSIAGKNYTVTINSATITDTVCQLNLTVKGTPLGNLNIIFN